MVKVRETRVEGLPWSPVILQELLGLWLLGEPSLSPPASGGADACLTTGFPRAKGALKCCIQQFPHVNTLTVASFGPPGLKLSCLARSAQHIGSAQERSAIILGTPCCCFIGTIHIILCILCVLPNCPRGYLCIPNRTSHESRLRSGPPSQFL